VRHWGKKNIRQKTLAFDKVDRVEHVQLWRQCRPRQAVEFDFVGSVYRATLIRSSMFFLTCASVQRRSGYCHHRVCLLSACVSVCPSVREIIHARACGSRITFPLSLTYGILRYFLAFLIKSLVRFFSVARLNFVSPFQTQINIHCCRDLLDDVKSKIYAASLRCISNLDYFHCVVCQELQPFN